ncbi:hypothetical protein POM88_043231 [Heracleum sosnowskyi]|uniref:CCHC-type domain-containing protein n=1 Tax=Heracleum sosnowskyi TaxID=360622 RepID=A0AAD8M441_9APIA|nr:hypothetical protein POM88_043231 [Heracleum sosnowskyi]
MFYIVIKCGNCGEAGHNKRTCKKEKKGGTSGASQSSNIHVVDEEEMREAYQEAVMEMPMPEDAPPLTQPSQPDNDDTPLAMTFKHIKKSKEVKKKGKAICMNESEQVHANEVEMHNACTGAMKLGRPPPPPVKQYKMIVGGTTIKSAPFQSHGKTVITKGALQAATKLPIKKKLDGKK